MPRRTAPKSPVTSKKRAPAPVFTLEERLANGGLLSIDEVCALAQVSRSSLYKAVREGRLSILHKGRVTRVAAREVQKYLGADAPAASPVKPPRKVTRSTRRGA